jgi:hypothetical protein
MDAFELLKADHKKVAGLFDELEAANGKAKLGIFNQIKNELELHTHIEEKIFYPVIEKPEETHDLTLEAYEEHAVVKTLLKELSESKSADDEWQAKAKVLRENVEHHVEEEEGELFDKAGDVLSDEQIEALGNQMEAEKARKLGRPAKAKTATAKKVTSASTKKVGKGGLLSKIANFVGLGDSNKSRTKPASKKAAKKQSAKLPKKASSTSQKSSTKKSSSRVSASKRGPGTYAQSRATTGKKAAKKTGRTASKKASTRKK